MSDIIHFIQVDGADDRTLDLISEKCSTTTDDNIIVTDETIEPIDRDEVKDWLQQLADALDMKLVDD